MATGTDNGASSSRPAPEMLEQWQGHRRLTRRVIEAFPEAELFAFSIGGMRPFAQMASELLSVGAPTVVGAATREWPEYSRDVPSSKAELLQRWDSATQLIEQHWGSLTPERLQENDVAFGMYPGTVYSLIQYAIDNEIHHRGQAYVYLRALGIEPPPFYER